MLPTESAMRTVLHERVFVSGSRCSNDGVVADVGAVVSHGAVADVDEAEDDDKLHAWNHNSGFLGVLISQDYFSFRGRIRGWERRWPRAPGLAWGAAGQRLSRSLT